MRKAHDFLLFSRPRLIHTSSPTTVDVAISLPEAMTASSSHLCKTNTDSLCCDPTSGPIRKFIYRFNHWTGLYMLEPSERLAFHAVVGIFVTSSCLYTLCFVSGFADGWESTNLKA
mmetsp:Transcript_22738/g.47213  ORF Transcript_22738/g.47213 Transcript_22738/m.47213 type:complete len:116 (-) Transcript_22738:5311-5658(-)